MTDGGENGARAGWSWPTFAAPLRGQLTPDLDPVQRWEWILSREARPAFTLTRFVAGVPVLRDLLRAGPVDAPPRGLPLGEREAAVYCVTASPLYQRLERLAGRRPVRVARRLLRRVASPHEAAHDAAAPSPPPVAAPARDAAPRARPELGPHTGRAVDEALAFLRTLPFEALQRRGWHLQPNHFYWPLVDVDFLAANRALWHDRGLPRGIEWDLDGQLRLLSEISATFGELADVGDAPPSPALELTFTNGSFPTADAYAYYGLVRRLQPRRVIEIGGGWSSRFLARALERNERPCDVVIVEPEPNEVLFAHLPPEWTVERALLQHVDLARFDVLEAGDVCFYDGTHCVRTAGDVNWFFFEVLPRLPAGVFIHVHDIHLPADYPDSWLLDEGLSWNEQYLVQAFLMHNERYRARLATGMLARLCADAVRSVLPSQAIGGGSLWIEKLAP